MNESSKPALDKTAGAGRSEGSPAGLDFPDWSGQVRERHTLSLEEMHRYCEVNLAHLRAFPGWRQRRLADRCGVEFVLPPSRRGVAPQELFACDRPRVVLP
jgi:hypothetical protein